MTRDATATVGIHPLTGALSSLGILLWWASASVWLFSAVLHRKFRSHRGFWFAVSSGFLSAYLALDDLFLFHEDLVPTYLGLPEKAMYAVLSLVMAAYLLAFRRLIVQRECLLLLFALSFLACSAFVDVVLEPWILWLEDWRFFIEDGLKWLGIVSWCSFCVVRCRADILSMIDQTTKP
ncbi:MAG: hypothetical protein HYV59_14330 [Planctomycetes bacterium]|nr:hypothetical protein [Planctomycetota bacterium]